MKLYKGALSVCAVGALALLPFGASQAASLQQVILHTLRTNPNVLLDADIRNAAKSGVRVAQADYLPTIDINAGIGRTRTKNPGSPSINLTQREAGVVLDQMLFNGFFTPNNVARTQAATNAAAYKVWGTADNTALLTTEAYMNVIRTKRLINIARRNLNVHLRTFRLVQQRSLSGLGRRAEINIARARLALSRNNYYAAYNNYRDAKITYTQITGLMPSGLSMPRGVANASLPPSVRVAIQRTVNENPFVRSASADVGEAEWFYKTTEAPFLPHLDFVLGAQSDRNINGIPGDDNQLSGMFQLSYNLYNGGGDAARQQQAAFEVEQAKDIKDRTIREAIQRTCLAWADLTTSRKQLPQLRTYANASGKTVKAYSEQFKLGKRTLLDLLDAQGEAFQARSEYVNERFNLLIAKYRLLNSVGVLVPYLRIPLPDAALVPYRERYLTNHVLTQVGGQMLEAKPNPVVMNYETHPDFVAKNAKGYIGKSRYPYKRYSKDYAVNSKAYGRYQVRPKGQGLTTANNPPYGPGPSMTRPMSQRSAPVMMPQASNNAAPAGNTYAANGNNNYRASNNSFPAQQARNSVNSAPIMQTAGNQPAANLPSPV